MDSNVEQIQQIQKIIQIILRRRILLLCCLLSILTAGLVFYLVQDKIYTSSALLVYQEQKVNPAKMSPDEIGKLKNVVSTLSPLVLSRTNLEEIIESQNLFVEMRQKIPMHDVVLLMRKRIKVSPSRQGNTFTVSYWDKNPQVVARVTNIIAGKFVEENLQQRQDRAVETSNYTRDELEMAKRTLDEKEAILRDYKLKYYNEMPEQRQDNMNRLTALQENYQGKQESIQDMEKTKILIQEQINARRQLLDRLATAEAAAGQQEVKTLQQKSPINELSNLKRVRAAMLERYTAKHPKIRSLNKRIAALEKFTPGSQAGDTSSPETFAEASGDDDKVLFDLKIQLKEVSLNVQEITQEMARTKKQIEKYEKWIAATPIREAEWAAISREYGELKKHYDFLVAQDLQAHSAMNLEKNQQGSQFKIKDTAEVPLKPIKPNFLQYILITFAAGAGLGGAIALCLEFLDTSFRNPESLEHAFGIDIIASVPEYSLLHEKKRKKLKCWIEVIFFSLWTMGLLAAIAFLWLRGRIII